MLTISANQMERMTRLSFYGRLTAFLRARSKSDALRRAAEETARCHGLWDVHWPAVKSLSEHDAALRLVFILVWQLEGGDVEQVLTRLAQVDDAELAMKRVLSERGHLRFSDFDHVPRPEGAP